MKRRAPDFWPFSVGTVLIFGALIVAHFCEPAWMALISGVLALVGVGLVFQAGLVGSEPLVRQRIADDYERMAGNCNPDDPEGSAAYSRWAMNVADRIRHPEWFSGATTTGATDD